MGYMLEILRDHLLIKRDNLIIMNSCIIASDVNSLNFTFEELHNHARSKMHSILIIFEKLQTRPRLKVD